MFPVVNIEYRYVCVYVHRQRERERETSEIDREREGGGCEIEFVLDEFYFTTTEKKLLENWRDIVPNFNND